MQWLRCYYVTLVRLFYWHVVYLELYLHCFIDLNKVKVSMTM